jgi:hypothetical protein
MNPAGGRGYWGWGRGFGGRGGGRGWRHWFYATGLPGWARAGFGYPYAPDPAPVAQAPTPESELAGLKQQAQYFQEAVDEINKRIEELEKAKQEG